METVFPEETGYAGFFLVGFRKDPAQPTRTQRVGTAILKRTYDITPALNPVQGRVTPTADPFPVFDRDVAENLVVNGNMEASQKAFGEGDSKTLPAAWKAETGATLLLAQNQGRLGTDDTGLQVTDDTGLQVTDAAESRVVQVISFDKPLGGRGFSLSLWAKADANTNTNNVRLEADGTIICNINLALTPVYKRFTATGVWPISVTAKEMRVVMLRTTTEPAHTVFYDDVEVSERNYVTKVDVAALRYESDLAPFKPEGDVVVLDFTDQAGGHEVQINGSAWMARTVNINGDGRDKALFGWEPRVGTDREAEAGKFSDNPDDYPPEWPIVDPAHDPLPPGPPASNRFKNRFYNGYRRDSRQLPVLPYFSPGSRVRIERPDPGDDYSFTLGSETATAQVRHYRGYGPDDERYWRSQNVPMHADTLVIEPEKNRCYVIWRGAWDFDAHPEEVYRQLVVSVT